MADRKIRYLTSIVNDDYTFEKIGKTSDELESFLRESGIDGFEILMTEDFQKSLFKDGMAVGNHLFFYPMWMDFIRGDIDEVLKEFKTEEAIYGYYRGKNRQDYVRNLALEFEKADKAGFSYVVMHVSHMNIREAYTGAYRFNDEEVSEEFISVINDALKIYSPDLDILLENNWYPGLTFLDNRITEKYIKKINHKRIGFTLDTGHLLNTDTGIENSDEAIEYLMEKAENLNGLREYIKCIHLNYCLSGEYVRNSRKIPLYDENDDFNQAVGKAMVHISKIDKHGIFNHNGIREFINLINPDYLVFELSFKDSEDLKTKIITQKSFIE